MMQTMTIDWSRIRSEDERWDLICSQGKEPSWHGRNMNALNDSWVNGGIGEAGPPYAFCFLNCGSIQAQLLGTADVVMEIARDSVKSNGGSYVAT